MFDREGSTLSIMDDLQIAVHSYDGCHKGCSGCLVDKHFKNQGRFQSILSVDDMKLVHSRVESYFSWIQKNVNTKAEGYFNSDGGFQVKHFSYTFRFGNHSELGLDNLKDISNSMNAPYKVFSTAPVEEIDVFIELAKETDGRIFLEIIYDPIVDDPYVVEAMIEKMRENGILGYPEILITNRLLDQYPDPAVFATEKLAPFGNTKEGVQVQFGRYTPSRTRNFSETQVVDIDREVEWLSGMAKKVVSDKINIHPIPLGEYAVTLLDEYGESSIFTDMVGVDESRISEVPESVFDYKMLFEKVRDIYITSLYVDHNLNLFIWSESVGQHILNDDLGFEPLGNLRDSSIQDIVKRDGAVDKMVHKTLRDLMSNKKCSGCRYKTFCSTHAVSLFRKWQTDDKKHCFGYIPVIREFQKDKKFLDNMIDGFRDIEF